MRIEVGDYVLEVDPIKTKNTYQSIKCGGAKTCGCTYCLNYLSVIQKAFPPPVLAFFSQAGIDIQKDAEVYEQGEILPGIRSYGGEYYLWGSVISEVKKEQILGKGFSFTFMQPTPLVQEQFKKAGALCFMFNAELPWVLDNE